MAGEGLCRPVRPKDICGFNSFSSQLDSKSVKHTALSLISVILKRALKTVDYCLDKEAWQEPSVYTAAMMEDFVQLFREALSKVGTAARLGRPGGFQGCPERCLRSTHQVEEMTLGAQSACEERGWGASGP